MGRAASICRNTEVLIGCQETCGLCRCYGGSQASGRAGSKRRSKKDRVISLARSIAGTQAKGLYMESSTANCCLSPLSST